MFSAETYWENRYVDGGTSGPGSRDGEADEKVRIVQSVINEYGIHSLFELGCGDGHVASRLQVPTYIGYDPSAKARSMCEQAMPDHLIVDQLPHTIVPEIDLTLSMDVIFHLIDDVDYQRHLTLLLGMTNGHVLIYGTNHDQRGAPHVLHREWLKDVPIGWEVSELLCAYKHAWLITWRKPKEAADVAGLITQETGELLERYASGVLKDQLIVEIGGYTGRSTCFLAQSA